MDNSNSSNNVVLEDPEVRETSGRDRGRTMTWGREQADLGLENEVAETETEDRTEVEEEMGPIVDMSKSYKL
jgi:hypothetical protein